MNRLISTTAIVLLSVQASAFAQGPTVPTLPLIQPEVGPAMQAPLIPNPFDNAPVEAPPLPAEVASDLEVGPQDPTSLPTGLRHRHRRSPVDAMVDYATLSGVADASGPHGIVDWGYGQLKAPNHIASILLREECVDGLWDSYPATRAAECELMWKRLTATKRCCQGCNGCGGCASGCGAGNCGQVNRYTQSCDGCDCQ